MTKSVFPRRQFAWIIDTLPFTMFLQALESASLPETDRSLTLILIFSSTVTYVLMLSIMENRYDTTIGKWALGLKITNEDNTSISVIDGVKRRIFAIILLCSIAIKSIHENKIEFNNFIYTCALTSIEIIKIVFIISILITYNHYRLRLVHDYIVPVKFERIQRMQKKL